MERKRREVEDSRFMRRSSWRRATLMSSIALLVGRRLADALAGTCSVPSASVREEMEGGGGVQTRLRTFTQMGFCN